MVTTTVPCLGTSTVPCLGTFASALPGHVCSPCLGRLPVPCLGTLASSLPGNACQCACPAWACLQSLPGTLASSLPGNACQFPAWERLPVPCLGTFCSPCLGRFASSLPRNVCQCPAWPGHVCQSLPGNAFCRDAVPVLFSHAYLRLF